MQARISERFSELIKKQQSSLNNFQEFLYSQNTVSYNSLYDFKNVLIFLFISLKGQQRLTPTLYPLYFSSPYSSFKWFMFFHMHETLSKLSSSASHYDGYFFQPLHHFCILILSPFLSLISPIGL